jgi:hypothetical protein
MKVEWTIGWHNKEDFTFEVEFRSRKVHNESCAHPDGMQDWKYVTCEVTITNIASSIQGEIPGTFVGEGRVSAQSRFWDMDVPDENKALAQMAFSSLLGKTIPCKAGVYGSTV